MAGQILVPFRRPLVERNRTCQEDSSEQADELHRMHRLKRYLSPQIADTILRCPSDTGLWELHRREITVVFLDLHGFTCFSNSAEPEEVVTLLRKYHSEMGKLVFKFEGTLERFAKDAIMVVFNDPSPCEQHTEQAVRMALEMRDRAKILRTEWLRQGYDLSLGIGLAAGYATVGNIGFEGRMDYGAMGKVPNLAYRLCEEASGNQILINEKTLCKIEDFVEAEPLEKLQLKGFPHPIAAFNIVRCKL